MIIDNVTSNKMFTICYLDIAISQPATLTFSFTSIFISNGVIFTATKSFLNPEGEREREREREKGLLPQYCESFTNEGNLDPVQGV